MERSLPFRLRWVRLRCAMEFPLPLALLREAWVSSPLLRLRLPPPLVVRLRPSSLKSKRRARLCGLVKWRLLVLQDWPLP